MIYTLRGRIAIAHPYQLDKTLTVEGAGADAKATGEAIAAVIRLTELHPKDNNNPHKVTKEQVGLGFVDNTSDVDKPVSTAQLLAIAEAKKAGTDAQQMADNAQAVADQAKKIANEKISKNKISVSLLRSNWSNNKQTVNAPGVKADPENDVFISAAPASYEVYAECMIRCSAQGNNSLTFECEEIPTETVAVNVIIFE